MESNDEPAADEVRAGRCRLRWGNCRHDRGGLSTIGELGAEVRLDEAIGRIKKGQTPLCPAAVQLVPATDSEIHWVSIPEARVTMPELTGLDLSGASRTTLAGFNSDGSLESEVSGASTLRGDLICGDASFSVSGASKVNLNGSAQDLKVEASGASTADLSSFASQNTVVNASGASKVIVNTSGTLDAEASGASTVRYTGDPAKVRENSFGASTVGPQ